MKKRSELIMREKALSPVVATILLVLLAILLVLILLLFSKSFVKDVVEKNEQPAEYSCEKVNLEAYLESDDLYITNVGNVPVYKIVAKKIKFGNSKIMVSDILVPNVEGEPGARGLPPGNIANVTRASLEITKTEFESGGGTYKTLKIIPILLGTVKGGSAREYTCPDEFAINVDV